MVERIGVWAVWCAGGIAIAGCVEEGGDALSGEPAVTSAAMQTEPEGSSMADVQKQRGYGPAGASEEWAQLAKDDWKQILTGEQLRIAREAGTERPFTGEYWKGGGEGVYKCVACYNPLFTNEAKFFSACGWPAFSSENDGRVSEHDDLSHGMVRTEVRCNHCGSHLGHVFNDGPPPTGLRYCINSESIVLDANGRVDDRPLTPEERRAMGTRGR